MKNNIKRLIGVGTGAMATLMVASPVLAQSSLALPPSVVDNFSITSLGEFLGALLTLLFLLAGIIVFAYLVWGGLQWITSGGDKAKTQEARDRITAALVGLAVIAVAWAVSILLQQFFGINLTSFETPSPYGV